MLFEYSLTGSLGAAKLQAFEIAARGVKIPQGSETFDATDSATLITDMEDAVELDPLNPETPAGPPPP